MEVLTDSDTPTLISNAEVLKLLQKNISKRKEIEAQQELKLQKQQRRRKRKEKEDKKKSKYAHRDWIEEHVHDYLKMTPCVAIKGPSQQEELKSKLMSSKRQQQQQSSSSSSSLSKNVSDVKQQEENDLGSSSTGDPKVTGFGLTQAETLQILNFMPTEPVEIHLMVEELHARMTEPRQEELLELIRSYRNDDATTAEDVRQEVLEEEVEEMEIIEEGGEEVVDPPNRAIHPMIKEEV